MLVSEILSSIERAYIGKVNHCCCGCSGNYYESDEKKQMIIGKILASQNVEDLGTCIVATIGKKYYIAYRTDEYMNKHGL